MPSFLPAHDLEQEQAELKNRLMQVRSRIDAAAMRYGREPGSVNLLAVSKQQPADLVKTAFQMGQRDFGENYLQEAIPKISKLSDLALIWHFIGQIQSNKTRPIAEHFDWAHTVDRLKIAERLNEQRPPDRDPLQVCIQVKLVDEAGKGGASPGELPDLVSAIAALPRLRLRGLMCIPPPSEEFEKQRIFFKQTFDLFCSLRRNYTALDTLSMGMSGDLEAAISAGATIVRVGSAIFGERAQRDTRRQPRDESK